MSRGPRSSRYAFLATGRWARTLAVGLLVSLACSTLGYWQWTRHTARLEAAALVDANYDAPVVPLGEVLRPGEPLDPRDAWRPVRVRGTYVAGGTVLLRNRPVDGSPAVHVLAPLVVTAADGTRAVLVVDRGWLPAGSEERPGSVPVPPTGAVDAVVRLRPVEAPSTRAAPPAGQAYAVEPGQVLEQAVPEQAVPEETALPRGAAGSVAEAARLPAYAGYGVLDHEDPGAGVAPFPLPRPDTDLGTHLSYTFQWWVFALGALVGVGVLARREADERATTAPAHPRDDGAGGRSGSRGRSQAGAGGARRVRASRRTAEQEEDALVDAQLAAERPAR